MLLLPPLLPLLPSPLLLLLTAHRSTSMSNCPRPQHGSNAPSLLHRLTNCPRSQHSSSTPLGLGLAISLPPSPAHQLSKFAVRQQPPLGLDLAISLPPSHAHQLSKIAARLSVWVLPSLSLPPQSAHRSTSRSNTAAQHLSSNASPEGPNIAAPVIAAPARQDPMPCIERKIAESYLHFFSLDSISILNFYV